MKPKQKEVTMWAIWHSDYGLNKSTFASTEKKAWSLWGLSKDHKIARNAYLRGFRAVKGKFVWEEK